MNREQTLHALGLGPLWKRRAPPEQFAKGVEAAVAASPVRAGGAAELRPSGEVCNWLFVQEGPVSHAAEPLLDAMLAAIDLKRGQGAQGVRVIVLAAEALNDAAALKTALERYQARLIIALGSGVAKALLGTELEFESARGQVLERQGIPLIVSYSPDYLLQNLPKKAGAWADLCLMRREARRLLD